MGNGEATRPQRWFGIAIVCGVLAFVLWLIATGRGEAAFRTRMVGALLSFALSSVSLWIFWSKATIKGKVLGLAIACSGPVALWLVGYSVFALVDYHLPVREQPVDVTSLIDHTERRLGWQPYEEWKRDLGPELEPIVAGRASGSDSAREEGLLSFILSRLLYAGSSERQRLDHVTIDVLFRYFRFNDRYRSVKFQRIRGTAESVTKIYAAGAASESGASTAVHLFCRARNGARPLRVTMPERDAADSGPRGNWVPFSPDDSAVDCMIVASYDPQVLPDGEWLLVDVNKYVAAQQDRADTLLAVVGPEVKRLNAWEMQLSQIADRRPAPLLFRPMFRPAGRDCESRVTQAFEGWLQELDRLAVGTDDVSKDGDAVAFLQEVVSYQAGDNGSIRSMADILSSLKGRGEGVACASGAASQAVFGLLPWGNP